MRLSRVRPLSLIGIFWLECGSLFSQSVVKPWSPPSKTEPGLELAVTWKWWVAPSATKEWGMPLPEALKPKSPSSSALDPATPGGIRPETYEVKKGDALIKIAKKFDMTVWQLMHSNELKDDRIKIGQMLHIPTLGQLLTMVPPPPPPPPPPPEPKKKKAVKAELTPEPPPDPDPGGEIQRELDHVVLQVFLDREMFSPGMIDGKSGATFLKICEIYQRTHPDAADPARLKAKAEATLKEPYTRYILRTDDFKFIMPPKDVPLLARGKGSPLPGKKNSKPDTAAPVPPPIAIDEMLAAEFLGYASAWEFVAERFHCDEAFLRRINPSLKDTPAVGAEFQVPNVIAFEIETALDAPLQPPADPQKPVTAAVVLLSRLEISREGKLIAVLPLTTARPGLRGRDKWTVLAAIPQPRMATKREPREIPKANPTAVGAEIPQTPAALEKEQYLAPGPNNPIGIIWLNLAKAGSTAPLPYGLHGTSIPAQMKLPGIGGLRLTNWDIARATRMMPAGTTLQWKAQ